MEWLKKGRDRIFQQKCKAINRYEVLGISPLKIILIIETDDPDALHLLSTHFGDAWNSVTYPIVQREIAEGIRGGYCGYWRLMYSLIKTLLRGRERKKWEICGTEQIMFSAKRSVKHLDVNLLWRVI